jgi:hypothetical protein
MSGFNHSAFCLNVEGRLDHTAFKDTFIRRGQLVDLLHKALIFSEVEAHWRNDTVTTNCKSAFSLISDHICSAEVTQNAIPVKAIVESIAAEAAENMDVTTPEGIPVVAPAKRKASDTVVDKGHTDKRARTRSPLATTPVAPPTNAAPGQRGVVTWPASFIALTLHVIAPMLNETNEDLSAAVTTKSPTQPLAVSEATVGELDPWAIRKLKGHKSEVSFVSCILLSRANKSTRSLYAHGIQCNLIS